MAPGVDSLNVAVAAAVAFAHLSADRFGTDAGEVLGGHG
jgi:hypothetical protein